MGNVDGEEGEGREVVDHPHAPPTPQWLLKALDPIPQPPGRQVLGQGCAGDQPFFSSPAHSHMTIMWIFRTLIRCLIRRKEGEHTGTWGKDASRGGGGSGRKTRRWCPPGPHA